MELKLIDTSLPILPLNSIGGINPKSNIKHYEDALNSLYFKDISLKGVSSRIVCIDYLEGLLKINIDIYSGQIYRVEAGNGYLGCIANYDIKVGIYVKDLLKYFSNDWEDDGQYLWNINFPSLYFSFLEENIYFSSTNLENYLDCKINKIGIIAPDKKGDYDFYGYEWYLFKEKLIEKWC